MIGVIYGASIGAVIALLIAPKSGKRLRRDIIHKKDELLRDSGKFLRKAKFQVSEIIEVGKRKAETIIDDAKNKVEDIM